MDDSGHARLERQLNALQADQQRWLALFEGMPVPVVLTEGPD